MLTAARLALDLEAFYLEHRRCGDLDTGDDDDRARARVADVLMQRADEAVSLLTALEAGGVMKTILIVSTCAWVIWSQATDLSDGVSRGPWRIVEPVEGTGKDCEKRLLQFVKKLAQSYPYDAEYEAKNRFPQRQPRQVQIIKTSPTQHVEYHCLPAGTNPS